MIYILDFINRNRRVLLLLLILTLVFVAIRIPGLDSPLHQDEYKWPLIVNPEASFEIKSLPHPPISQFVYRVGGEIVGYDTDFRYIPLFFGTLNLLLLFYFMNLAFGKKEAIISVFIWIFSFFSVLASLMVDTDGAVMPFFFLISLIGYYKLKYIDNKSYFSWIILALGIIGGFLVKISFVLVPLALIADFLWSRRNYFTRNQLLKYVFYGGISFVLLLLMLFLAKFIFPFFDFTKSLIYLTRFFSGPHGWFQTGIQVVKAFLYSSPLLILTPFFGSVKLFSRVKALFFFLFFAFIFYIIIFDSSLGALDRYLQLLILPLTILTSVVIGTINWKENPRYKKFLIGGILVGILIFLLQFLPHYVPSLHPKTEWITRFMSLKWNFVYPFSGGSGPLGFYVSFLVLASTWTISFLALIAGWIKPHLKKSFIIFLIPISFIYSSIFIEEYSFGEINGSAPKLLVEAVKYIEENPEIKMVTVYNDNGGDEIMRIGKYRKRLYTDPMFDINVKVDTLNTYKEHYFVLDVPRIDPQSPYQAYLESCEVVYKKTDRKISSTIFDCRNAPDLIL